MPNFTFSTPALIQDFSDNPSLQQKLNQTWDLAIDAYTQAALVSNPWTVDYQAPCDWYVNPKNADITAANPVEPIFWTAFPNRLRTARKVWLRQHRTFFYDSETRTSPREIL